MLRWSLRRKGSEYEGATLTVVPYLRQDVVIICQRALITSLGMESGDQHVQQSLYKSVGHSITFRAFWSSRRALGLLQQVKVEAPSTVNSRSSGCASGRQNSPINAKEWHETLKDVA